MGSRGARRGRQLFGQGAGPAVPRWQQFGRGAADWWTRAVARRMSEFGRIRVTGDNISTTEAGHVHRCAPCAGAAHRGAGPSARGLAGGGPRTAC